MRDPLSRFLASGMRAQDSWLDRVRDNFHQFLSPTRIFPTSANGAPIHLLKFERSKRSGRAQSLSLLTHATLIAALALLVTHPPGGKQDSTPLGPRFIHSLPAPKDLLNVLRGSHPSDGRGAGGNQNPIPATRGDLVPVSSIQLVKPSLPPKRETELPVPPTILDPKALPVLRSTEHIGLPWMKDYTDSPGPGKGGTIGSTDGTTMGDSPYDGPGGDGVSSQRYQPGSTSASCAYCPDPQYTDEAREAKLQGTVTLQVLVGADGRASQIRLVRGIGLGLDDRAVQSVRNWKFIPARDPAHRPVPSWVTIEAIFRLF
jgi:periplasmic protein TonB